MRNQSPEQSFDKANYLNNLLSGKFKEKNVLLNNILEESSGGDAQTKAMNAKAIANKLKNEIPESAIIKEAEIPVQHFTFGEQSYSQGPEISNDVIERLTGKKMPKNQPQYKPSPIFEQKSAEPQKQSTYGLDEKSLNEIKNRLKEGLLEEMKEEVNMYIIEVFSKQRIKNILKEIYTESKAK